MAFPSLLQVVLKQYPLNSASMYMYNTHALSFFRSQTATRLGMRTHCYSGTKQDHMGHARMGDNTNVPRWLATMIMVHVISANKLAGIHHS